MRETTGAPLFSVVLARASRIDRARILAVLDALNAQRGAPSFEMLVIDRVDDHLTRRIAAEYPGVRLLPAAPDASIADMRTTGARAALGSYVAITEDHCVPSPDWLAAFADGFARQPSAIGVAGPVENGLTARVLDRATFLFEYARFVPPLSEASANAVAGVNIAYRADILRGIETEKLASGLWDVAIHPDLVQRGKEFAVRNAARVVHTKHFSTSEFLMQRLLYSRYFGGQRFAPHMRARRLFAAMACIVLPALLFWRAVRRARHCSRATTDWLPALPHFAVFAIVAAAGEWLGYVAGVGDSLRKLE